MQDNSKSSIPEKEAEDVIELTDVVSESAEDEEDVIELEEMISPSDEASSEPPVVAGNDQEQPPEEDLLDLLSDPIEADADDTNAGGSFSDPASGECAMQTDADTPVPEVVEPGCSGRTCIIPSPGEGDKPEEDPAAMHLPIQDLEAALERIVKNAWSEKIEGIITDIIRETVRREIDRIKKIMLESDSDTHRTD